MGDYQRILSGEIGHGWQLLIPPMYLSGPRYDHVLCDYGWSKEIIGDDLIRKKHDSSILITEQSDDLDTVTIRRFSTISQKINADLAVIHANWILYRNSIYLTPNILGVVFGTYGVIQRLKIVVFNAFSPQEKFAVWKITAPGAEYGYGFSMFLDEHSHRLIIIFKTVTSVPFFKGFAMVAYELSEDYGTILNDGSGTIIYEKNIKLSSCISLGDNEAIMGVVEDGENGPELGDVVTINRIGVKCRQSAAEWLEICKSQRPDFMHVTESYGKLQIDEPTDSIFRNISAPFAWFLESHITPRCIVGAWYAKTRDGILCKRTQVDSLKNLAAKAMVGMYPSEMDGAQLRARMKTVVGFDVFEAVTEEEPLSVEVN